MKAIIFPILICFFHYCQGQVLVTEIKEYNSSFPSDTCRFPKIAASNTAIANKINDTLVSSFLGIERSKVQKSIFEHIWQTEEDSPPAMRDISYEVIGISKHLLALSISAEGCGAYCEYFILHYVFNLKTGNRVYFHELLSEKGKAIVIDSIRAKRKRLISHQLLDADRLGKSPHISLQDKEFYNEMTALYTDCLAQRESGYYEDLTDTEFHLTQKKLIIYEDRCSAHANRAIDELGSFEFEFDLNEFKPFFTPLLAELTRP